jgi:DNA repair exonuclease SbcCD ATPase subunit
MSDDDAEQSQVNVKVPKRTKELAKEKLEHGGLTRLVREELARVAHGEKVSQREKVRDHLQELRDKKRDKISERNNLDDEIAQLDVKIERAEAELEKIDDVEGKYDGYLQSIEDQMHEDGMNVFQGHAMVQKAAKLGECDEEDVIEDLKSRNPELDPSRFQQGAGHHVPR